MLFRVLRFAAQFLIVAGAWFAWWILPASPLRRVEVDWGANFHDTTYGEITSGQERLIHLFRRVNGLCTLVDLDLDKGTSTELVSDVNMREPFFSKQQSYAVWYGSDGIVHIVKPAAAGSQFTINPQFEANPLKRYYLTGSSDDRYLAIVPQDGNGIEIWDIPAQSRSQQLDQFVERAAFSPNGSRVAGFMDTNRVGVWDIASGHQLAEIDAPGPSVGCVSFAPDGRLLIGQSQTALRGSRAIGRAQTFLVPAQFTLWSADYLSRDREFTKLVGSFQLCRFSSDGRFGLWTHQRADVAWDFAPNPPQCLDPQLQLESVDLNLPDELGLEKQQVRLDPNGRRLVVLKRISLLPPGGASLTLRELPSLSTILLEEPNQITATFSPSGRWLTGFALRPPSLGPWLQWIIGKLPTTWISIPDDFVVVRDAQTGRIANRLAGKFVTAWNADESAVWLDMSEFRSGKRVFGLWSTVAAAPPWWLWLATAIGVSAIAWDMRRTWKRRPLKSVEA
ncbi:MAG: WD40 repeat domain-containing protein [Gemmataceae bacterium]